jgi:general secretion pathway protein A
MYWEHLGFTEQPFALTPNPDFLFLSACHQEAFAHLIYGIDHRVGFIVLSGEVGTGKTTLIRTLLNRLDPASHRTALIFNPTLSPTTLLQEINREFGIDATSKDNRELIAILNAFLLAENEADRTVLLVIDEAQNLSPEVLEQIRLISNLETEQAKLIQIILVGQPELKRLLAREELRQLDQRITVSYHLRPMGFSDTAAYISHRIKIAAEGKEPVTFSVGATRRIYAFSKGLPRLINAVCDRALLTTYTHETRGVTPSIASTAIADIRKNEPPPPLSRRFAITLALLVIALATAGTVVLSGWYQAPKAKQVAPPPARPAFDRTAALTALAATPQQENTVTTLNAILKGWQVPTIALPAGQTPDLKTMARQRGFMASEMKLELADVTRIDTPLLLHIPMQDGSSRLLAVTGLSTEGFRIVPQLGGRTILTKGELLSIWDKRGTILWKNFLSIPTRLRPGISAKGVKPLQELLTGTGYYGGKANGRFDAATSQALKAFQQSEGLRPDGLPGEETLMLLYRRAGGYFPAGLTNTAQKQGAEVR